VNVSSDEDKQDKRVYTGFAYSGAVKFGLFAIGLGVGGYLVYRVCSRK